MTWRESGRCNRPLHWHHLRTVLYYTNKLWAVARCRWYTLLESFQVVGVDGVVIRTGVLHPILLINPAGSRYLGPTSRFWISWWQRIEKVRNPPFVRVSNGEGGHATIAHSQNNRSENWYSRHSQIKLGGWQRLTVLWLNLFYSTGLCCTFHWTIYLLSI